MEQEPAWVPGRCHPAQGRSSLAGRWWRHLQPDRGPREDAALTTVLPCASRVTNPDQTCAGLGSGLFGASAAMYNHV